MKTRNHCSFFFSDIVGYSKMVERDENLAFRLLQEHNGIIEKAVTSHDGRIVKYIGDSVFAEFEKPGSACDAALTIQAKLQNRNQLSRLGEQIHIRLGIHSGEAIREDGDLFGNDINIASRIESIAQPGAVFISNAVLVNVASPSEYLSRPIEHVKLKNIHTPQTLHKLYPNKKKWEQESAAELMEALIETGVNFIAPDSLYDYDNKSIGIMVFESVGDDYYGYGLCNDLISEFDRISQVYVADIQDVMRFKSSELAPADIARKLEVDNILDGICRIDEKRIHISLRMVSTETGKTVWKEELSELTANLNALRGTIVKKVLEVLDVKVPDFILEKMSKGMTNSPEAYKLYHEGLYKIEIVKNTDEYPAAKSLFAQAVEYDENFLEASAQQAITSFKMGHAEEAEELIDEALDKAEELKNEQGKAKLLDSMGILLAESVKFNKAVKFYEKALKIQVKFEDQLAESKTLHNLSHCYINLNQVNKGIEMLGKSILLKEKMEKDNLVGSSLAQLGNAYRSKFQYVHAIDNYRKALGKFTRYQNDYFSGRVLLLLARCFCEMGKVDKTKEYLYRAEEICCKFNEPLIMGRIKNYEANVFFLEQNYKETIDCLNAALEIFQDGGLSKPTADLLIEMMWTMIVFDKPDKLEKRRKKYERLSKKLSDSGFEDGIIKSIDFYMQTCGITNNEIDLKEIEESLEKIKLSEEQYMGWWILAKSAQKLKDVKAEKKYYKKASEYIKQFADNLGEDEFKQSFLNKFPVREILELVVN